MNERLEVWDEGRGTDTDGFGAPATPVLLETRWAALKPMSVFAAEKYQARGLPAPTHRIILRTDGLAVDWKSMFFKLGSRTFRVVGTPEAEPAAQFFEVPVTEDKIHA